ncbi:MAG TPA: MarR family transcriptional regulator [Campylobacterales bacterium]|nr:MarR family transcriptional regulator [Campylobacterales bacterium]
MSSEKIDKHNSLGYHIHVTANQMRNNFNAFLQPYNIYTEQFALLCSLNEYGTSTVSQLAEYNYKDKTTISRLVDSLIKKEFITREPSPTDRRSYLISLTDKGQALYDEIGLCLEVYERKKEESVTPEEKAIAIKVLTHLREMDMSETIQQLQKENAC